MGYGPNQLVPRNGPCFRSLRAVYCRLRAQPAAATPGVTPHFETLLNRYNMTLQEALIRERRVVALRDASRFVGPPSE